MVEVAQNYEMVGNFNNFKAFVMFAVKIFFDYAYVSHENVFDLAPPPPPPPLPSTTFSGKICMTSPPNVDGFTTSLIERRTLCASVGRPN
jgi:hypothetical protein